jgi:hypothetical protein
LALTLEPKTLRGNIKLSLGNVLLFFDLTSPVCLQVRGYIPKTFEEAASPSRRSKSLGNLKEWVSVLTSLQ